MAVTSVFDTLWSRMLGRKLPPYVDITGTTNATLNTQTLFPHTLKNQVGVAIIPSKIDLDIDGTGGTPAGFVYEMPATHTTANVDIRGSGASVKFRARLWV